MSYGVEMVPVANHGIHLRQDPLAAQGPVNATHFERICKCVVPALPCMIGVVTGIICGAPPILLSVRLTQERAGVVRAIRVVTSVMIIGLTMQVADQISSSSR